MSGSSATSTLDIILKDDVSGAARAVAASLEKVQAEAKQVDEALSKSGTRDVLQSRLKQLGASRAQIEGAAKAWADYSKAEGLALDKSKDWTKAQRQQVAAWEGLTVRKLKADQGLARAREYAEVAAAKKAEQLDEKAHQRRMQMAAQEAAARHRQEERLAEARVHGEAHHGIRNYLLQSAALAVSAHGIMSVIENAVEHGAEYQHRLVALRNAGRSEAEITQMQAASHAALRGAPTATLTGNLEILNETVGAFGSVEHAIEHLGFMNKAASVLHAVAGDKIGGSPGEMGNQLARFFEMRGTAGNGEVFEREASEMMKSMIFTGGNVNPRELLNFAQQAKSSLQNYSIEFLSRIAPSLIGEVGGDRAGTQANAFNSVILGKANDAKQAAAWVKYGLIDPKMMTGKGDQKTGWTGGAIYHTDEFLKNPLQAIEDRLLPALERKGVDINNPLELTKVLGTLFRNINAAAFANELAQAQNRKRLHKDAGYVGDVDDPETIYRRLLQTDPTVAIHALKGSLENLLTTVSSPLMGSAASSMSGLAENLNELAIVAHDHPLAAAGTGLVAAAGALATAGALSYKLLNGFGNATFGPAAGEMVAAGHEQLAAGRTMLAAAEAMEVAAGEGDLAGVIPGGRKGGGAIGRGVVKEGEAVAEGVAEGAVGNRIVGAVEGALKGGLKADALEIAAAGVTLSTGTVAFLGLSAAAIIAGLKASTEPKHRASDEPGFGNPFAPRSTIDLTDPRYRAPEDRTPEEQDQLKPWWNRNGGAAHPRGSLPAYRDTDHPGHWVDGPHGTKHWALDDDRPMKNIPFFATPFVGSDGLPSVGTRAGMPPDPTDRRTWAHFDGSTPIVPKALLPDEGPWPPARPVSAMPTMPPLHVDPGYPGVDQRSFGSYLHKMAPAAAAGEMPTPTPPPGFGPVPTAAPAVDTSKLHAAADEAAQVGTAIKTALDVTAAPQVDASSIDAAHARATEAGAAIKTALDVTAAPIVEVGSINAASSAVERLLGLLARVGAAAADARSAVASIGGGGVGASPGPNLASRMRGGFSGSGSRTG